MPKPPNKPFRGGNNAQILNAIRKDASPQYQTRIPEATKATMERTIDALYDGRNGAQRNEFIDALVNVIGMMIVRNNNWTNPFREFKRGMLEWGESIEEIQVGLLRAHAYDASRDELEKAVFGQERPEVQSSIHKINRENYYKITVNDSLLRRAFYSYESGLTDFINQLMAAPSNSDEFDEFLAMTSLFAKFDERDGFFNTQVDDVSSMSSTESQAKSMLRHVRAARSNMQFPSRRYNAAGMEIAAKADELILFTTPEVKSGMDVNALAAAFNVGYAEAESRVIDIPAEYFGIPGIQGLLTTKDFFVVADTVYESRTVENPAGLYHNHFLHHHQIISASRFAPAMKFSLAETTVIDLTPLTITSVEAPTANVLDQHGDIATAGVEDVERGGVYQINAKAVPSKVSDGADHVELRLAGAESAFTSLSQTGALLVGHDEGAETLTVTAVSAYDDTKEASTTLNVTGDQATVWPSPHVTVAGAGGE